MLHSASSRKDFARLRRNPGPRPTAIRGTGRNRADMEERTARTVLRAAIVLGALWIVAGPVNDVELSVPARPVG